MSRDEFIASMERGYIECGDLNLSESRTYERVESEASTLCAWEVNR